MKLLKALLVGSLLTVSSMAMAQLKLSVFYAKPDAFAVTSTLVMGEKEAILIDTGFSRADALRIAAEVLDSQKRLTTILVSQADPDYYFGVSTLKAIFPEAKVVAPPQVLAEIKEKLETKLSVWTPQLGTNQPLLPMVLPEALDKPQLTLENEVIEIRDSEGQYGNRPFVWIPSLKTITGNVNVYGNMHLWTADSQTKASREAWQKQLDEMLALNPECVIPGHQIGGAKEDKSLVEFNKKYLTQFEEVLSKNHKSEDVIKAMEKLYPNLQGVDNLEFSAKVNTGEVKWD
ncbi:MBL fold metallo-hydrolase [Basilea psittacipulmonis]|uniref:Beta-lactamase n=1 Tax=Basilea psittacipulmonis DSM 24701 TaxID=1072685 RepID=A0A077DAU2_9BURK|nr:MBL fold metallo-hydrolase [Basilea psittacipulmonis]AIL32020.1 beta-lactamase [Basilea psittacipulmonis DSM 24701]